MNAASQNLSHHLEVLRAKLLHPTDYELALSYFLEEFAGDTAFVRQSLKYPAPHLFAVLGRVAKRVLEEAPKVENFQALRLAEFKFVHGSAMASGRVALFFYFEELDTGLIALTPGAKGGTEVARFRLSSYAAGNPQNN